MSRTHKIKPTTVDPFKIEQGHANWKMRKMGIMTAKGRKINRSVRNRFTDDDVR